ncbi:MAG: MiaB/RimO family radical SAM methylthiotransferase [Bacteroidota bacterium]
MFLAPAQIWYFKEMKRVHAITLGCKINQAETDDLIARLGLARVPANGEADLVLVNTCTVTMEADKQSRQLVRRFLNRGCPVVVTGCSAAVHPETFEELGATVVPKERLIETIETLLGPSSPALSLSSKNRTRGFLKVSEGCTNGCTYCIVPAARGAECHRPLSDLLEPVERFSQAHLQEVVLAGTRLGAHPDLPQIVRGLIERFPSIPRWRLSSIEPMDLTPAILALFEHPRVCPSLHLPLQSGSDRILARMNRRYSREEYLRTSKSLKEKLTLTTDLIVGFPGESDEDFEQSLEVLETCGFASVHAFPFSPRPGTPAASLPPVDPRIVHERLARVLETSGKLRQHWLEGWVGKEVDVLVERVRDPLRRTGLTPHYLRVAWEDQDHRQGELVRIRIERADGDGVWGESIS